MTAVRSPSELVGEMVGQFRVGQPLAGAQSGLLYNGWDYASGGDRKRVWLQFIDERQAGDAGALRRQVDAWRGFQHKAVLPIVGFEGEATSPPLVAVGPGDGDLLSQRLEGGRLDLVDAIQVVLTIARAVASAHAANLVHLGISEENVVVPKFSNATPAVFGFGVGGRFARGGVAKWHYLAPEQIVDEIGGDVRADVYALGVLLYRCTTGQYPVALADGLSADDTASQLTLCARRDPRQWFELPHAGLVDVINRAVHKNRERRFQTAEAFVSALLECGLPIGEIPPEKSDPKGVVLTPPPAGAPAQRASVHAPTISPTPPPASKDEEVSDPWNGEGARPKTLTIDEPTASELKGIVLNDVLIGDKIGEGGMAKIYLAKHLQLGRTWVVKVGEVGSAAVNWFDQEARVTAHLRENGERRVPEVLALGRLPDQRPYMIMEFVAGRTLAKVLADAPSKRLPLIRTLKIVYRIADTLERAHGLGVVHRDIKPDNLMVELIHGQEDANVRVLDWGIAKATGAAKQVVTSTGMLIGTPGYLSPEGVNGEKTDGRSDVFSVACVMYEMLAGNQPFPGDDPLERARATLGFHPEPLKSLRPDLGKYAQEVSDLITLGMTKHKANRPTMEMFRAALKEIMDNIEQRRQPNAPSALKTMLSAMPIRPNVPLPEQATHAPLDSESEEARPRFVAPDVTRPARRIVKPGHSRTGLRIALVALVVLLVGAATYAVISHRATNMVSAPLPSEAAPQSPHTAEPATRMPGEQSKPTDTAPPTPPTRNATVSAPATDNKLEAPRPAKRGDTKRTKKTPRAQKGTTINPFEE